MNEIWAIYDSITVTWASAYNAVNWVTDIHNAALFRSEKETKKGIKKRNEDYKKRLDWYENGYMIHNQPDRRGTKPQERNLVPVRVKLELYEDDNTS